MNDINKIIFKLMFNIVKKKFAKQNIYIMFDMNWDMSSYINREKIQATTTTATATSSHQHHRTAATSYLKNGSHSSFSCRKTHVSLTYKIYLYFTYFTMIESNRFHYYYIASYLYYIRGAAELEGVY